MPRKFIIIILPKEVLLISYLTTANMYTHIHILQIINQRSWIGRSGKLHKGQNPSWIVASLCM